MVGPSPPPGPAPGRELEARDGQAPGGDGGPTGADAPPEAAAADAGGSTEREAFDPLAHYMAGKGRRRTPRQLPRLVGTAITMSREASPRLSLASSALQLLTVVVLLLQVLLAKLAFEGILATERGGSATAAVLPLVGLLATVAFSGLATATQAQLRRLLGEHVKRSVWLSILDVCTRVDLETYESGDFHDELQRVQINGITQPLTMTNGLTQVVGGLLGVLALGIVLLVIEPLLVPVLVVVAPPLALLSRRRGRLEYAFRLRQSPEERQRSYLQMTLTGRDEAKEVRAFGLAEPLTGMWQRSYGQYVADLRDHLGAQFRTDAVSAVATTVALSLAFGLLILFVSQGRLPLAEAGAAIIAARLLSQRLQTTSAGVGALFESSLFLGEYEAFLRWGAAAPASATVRPTNDHPAPAEAQGAFAELRVDGLGFRYPGTPDPVLQDVSLHLRRGELVALVGENGSGKTTLAKVLAHLFTPTAGTVRWDGTDVRELPPEAVRRNVAVIFQDYVRFVLTAGENIGIGRAEAMDDRAGIEEAARRSGAHDAIEALPGGYDARLGRQYGGYDLSGGQWQRVALARGFFRQAGFLVLDEPTAALDPRSEHALFERMRELAAGRAVLFISHRFSSVRSADRIYVMHEGRIVERGNHEELMGLEGRYAELFSLQAEAYR